MKKSVFSIICLFASMLFGGLMGMEMSESDSRRAYRYCASFEHFLKDKKDMTVDTGNSVLLNLVLGVNKDMPHEMRIAFIKKLLKKGGDPLWENANGESPWQAALKGDDREIVQLMLPAVIDSGRFDFSDENMLDLARGVDKDLSRSSRIVLIGALLYGGGNPLWENAEGETAWLAAVNANELEMVQLMAPIVADSGWIDFADGSGMSALMYAASAGNEFVVQELMRHGAQIECNGFSAIALAHENAWYELADKLAEVAALISEPSLPILPSDVIMDGSFPG